MIPLMGMARRGPAVAAGAVPVTAVPCLDGHASALELLPAA